MSQEVQNEVMHAVTSFGGQQALRCLALAYKTPSTAVNKVQLITSVLARPELSAQFVYIYSFAANGGSQTVQPKQNSLKPTC